MFKTPKVQFKRKARKAVAKNTSESKLPERPKPCLLDYVDNKVLKLILWKVNSSDDLKSCKLVCKKFNKVVKEAFPGKGWLWLKNETFIEDTQIYKDMCSGRRDIVNFAVGESYKISPVTYLHNADDFFEDAWYFSRIQSVIGIAYRANINQIQLMNLELSVTKLLTFLSYIDDFHTLKLFFLEQSHEKQETIKVPPDALPFIENIIVYDCDLPVLKMITYLQPNSIRSLTIKVANFDELEETLKKQHSIVKLSLNCSQVVPVPDNLFAGHEFTHLTLNVAPLVNLAEFLTQFMVTLQFLDICNSIDNETFGAITEMPNLNRLCVNFADVSEIHLIKITKLKKLSSLVLHGGTLLHLEVLVSLKRFHLDFFDYPNCEPHEAGLVQALKQKFNDVNADIARMGG